MDDPGLLEVVVVNFNGRETLPGTLSALVEAGIRPEQIILSDDASTDGSPEEAARTYPGIRMVRQQRNLGSANGVRNAGLALVGARYAFLTDNDIIVTRESLQLLLQVLLSTPGAVIVTPRLVDASQPDEIRHDGNRLHFLGLSGDSPRGLPVDYLPSPSVRPTFGGGIMMFDTRVGKRIGWMDCGYRQGWASDAEVQLRVRALGYEALHESRATMTHFGKNHGTRRALGQMSNRYRLILTYFSWYTILILLPSLGCFEIALTLTAIKLGVLDQRIDALRTTWRSRKELRLRRSEIQTQRQRSDLELLTAGSFELPGVARERAGARALMHIASFFLGLNWQILRMIMRFRGDAGRGHAHVAR